jgi:uncharacterized 2Fe-2S/4Fe-4S cluster protein (DUF4445 family)
MALVIKTAAGERVVQNPRNDVPLSVMIHRDGGFSLDLQCSGLGICKKCAVDLVSGIFLCRGEELRVTRKKPVRVLSCATYLRGANAEIFIPESSLLKSEGKIYDDFELPEFSFAPLTRKIDIDVPPPSPESPVPDWERISAALDASGHPGVRCRFGLMRKIPGILKKTPKITVTVGEDNGLRRAVEIEARDASYKNLGAAVDIGTTTVVVAVADMTTGEILSKASAYNQQMSMADDVASRISAASASPEQLKYMQKLVVDDTINPLLKAACEKKNLSADDILCMAVSGNTVMSHLFLGLSPESIGALPFQPVTNIYPDCSAGELGLLMRDCGTVKIVPSIAGYVGGDISSDIYASGLTEKKGVWALVDLGTNSEMVVSMNGELFASAAAAGPAFEGAGLLCGCRASDGAVEHIRINENLEFEIDVIDGAPPRGICGSAIIDFIAEAFRTGLINSFGRFDIQRLKQSGRMAEVPSKGGKSLACVLFEKERAANGSPILVSEADIEQALKAKAAVYAGLKTLLSQRGSDFGALDGLILAGGFAKYINVGNAVTIGMLPEIPPERISVVGNGSLAGAYLTLFDARAREEFKKIIRLPKVISLNTIPDFEMSFVDALMLPNFNEAEFPGVMAGIPAAV